MEADKMSKNIGIIAILTIFMIAGTIPFVMGAEPVQLPAVLNEKMVASGLSIQNPNFSMQHSAELEYGEISPDTWYYGKINNIWPWMISDCTTFDLKSDGKIYSFCVKPASTDEYGWSNAFMQNQIVDCLISADTSKHSINVHTDANCQVDGVVLSDTRW
jgi:hypothetical protein